jgi:hemerythrin-like domain-containing protein
MQRVDVSSLVVLGMRSPSASWEQPFELLHACHERASRMLALLVKLQGHLVAHGVDEHAIAAAVDVMRYFDLAAPLHHRDEEEHVFPLAFAADDNDVAAAVTRLAGQHAMMEAVWKGLRIELLALAAPDRPTRLAVAWGTDHLVCAFRDLYCEHIGVEERVIYPYVQQRLSAASTETMGQAMAARRGAVA